MRLGEVGAQCNRRLELGDCGIVLAEHHIDTPQREVGHRILVVQGERLLRRR